MTHPLPLQAAAHLLDQRIRRPVHVCSRLVQRQDGGVLDMRRQEPKALSAAVDTSNRRSKPSLGLRGMIHPSCPADFPPHLQ